MKGDTPNMNAVTRAASEWIKKIRLPIATKLTLSFLSIILLSSLIFTIVGIFYVGFWLALAMLFSLLFQKTVTAALASMAVWLFLSLFVAVISGAVANMVVPDATTPEALARKADIENIVGRISPSTLFNESVGILLNPAARVFGMALQSQAEGILPTPLALEQSLTLIWPHITTMFALVAVCFGISYIIFMRAEIRA